MIAPVLLFFKIDIHRIETFFAPVTIIVVAFVLGKVLSMLLRRYIRRSAKILKVDPTNYSFLQNAVSLVVFLAAVFFVVWSIPELHDVGKTLFAGAGILAAIIGFASQEAFSNIISGIFIVIYKPFSVGDSIKLLSNNQSGTVEDITLRHTVIIGNENRRIVVPNSVISREQILNSSITDERIQLYFDVLLAYEGNHNRAMEIIQEEALKHPLHLDERSVSDKTKGSPPVQVKVTAFEDKGVRLRAFIWTKNDADAYNLKCDMLKAIKERFAAEKIKIAHDEQIFELKKD
jgi:small-conductance mechanosensitive channel